MKNLLRNISAFFSGLFEKNFFIQITSLVSAVLIWFFVSVSVYSTIEDVFLIPVTVDITDTYAEANNYKVVEQSLEFVTVTISGDRGQIGGLEAEDFVAVVSAENVFSPEPYNLQLSIQCLEEVEFEVEKLSDSAVTVSFDEIINKEVPVKPLMRTSEVSIAAGFICDEDDVAISPDTVTVTGPKEDVDKITSAYVHITAGHVLSETYDYVSEELVILEGRNEISNDDLIFSNSSFNVHIPILKTQVVSLAVRITNAPDSFNTEAFTEQLIFSDYELNIAAPGDEISDIPVIEIGAVDMREVDIGSVFTFYTSNFLPEGYQNLSEVNTITVMCPSNGLAKAQIHIRNSAIHIVNQPAQFDYEIIASGLTPYFIGPEEIISELSYIDVLAQIDLFSNTDLTEGDYKFPVLFSTPAYDDVWCIGTYGTLSPKATVSVTLKK